MKTFPSACNRPTTDAEVQRAIDSVNVIDASNLNELMLTSGDPKEAVAYFAKASAADPSRTDLKRGLARSLIRAQRAAEAVQVWQQVTAAPDSTHDDRVSLADAYIRTNDWTKAEAELNKVPPTHETFERYRLEAMVADSKKDWKKADSSFVPDERDVPRERNHSAPCSTISAAAQ